MTTPALPVETRLAPDVLRRLAPNPSMMTGPGTNTYLIGNAEVAVIDPGPAIEAHIDALIAAAPGPVRWIITTHTHPDHSPAAAELAERTGAQLIGMPAPDGEHQDLTFAPDRVPADGDLLRTEEFELQFIHTPGHASNHVCIRHLGHNWLVTGDHVIDGSTVVINPPDGDMYDYIESLRKIRALELDALLPGHGDRVDEPNRLIDWLIAHRLKREAKVAAALAAHPGATSAELVPTVYAEVDPALYGWAERSLLAHLLKLERDGAAVCDAGRWQPASVG